MNESQHARREARAIRDRETATALAEVGITPTEATLFYILHLSLTVPPSDLCRRATIDDYAIGGPVTRKMAQAALADCLAKEWLQVVDEAVLARLKQDVRCNGLIGPVYGYPQLGGVDFTHAGADEWQIVRKHLWEDRHERSFACCDLVQEKTAHFFSSESAARAECEAVKEYDDFVSVTGPQRIGPWRAQWWRRFPDGYRIDVEQRRQWQGRYGGSGGGSIFLGIYKLPFGVVHARNVLDRHNISWAQWLVMRALEDSNDRQAIVSFAANRSARLGATVTEASCHAALDECLRYGWLGYVDDAAIAQVRQLLRADPTFVPVPFQPEKNFYETDFTLTGAQLYRTLSAEIFGHDWEEKLAVEDRYYREVHYYCATEQGFRGVKAEFAESGEVSKTTRTMPIGPWCVYWWQRCPSGFRLELTFGES